MCLRVCVSVCLCGGIPQTTPQKRQAQTGCHVMCFIKSNSAPTQRPSLALCSSPCSCSPPCLCSSPPHLPHSPCCSFCCPAPLLDEVKLKKCVLISHTRAALMPATRLPSRSLSLSTLTPPIIDPHPLPAVHLCRQS